MPPAPAAPPAAPAAPAAPSAPAAPAAARAPKEIHVNAPAIDKGPESPPPKPGSARANLFNELRRKAGAEEPPAQPQVKPPVVKPDEAPDPGDQPDPGEQEQPGEQPGEQPQPGEAQPPAAQAGKKKPSPWKLVDEHKAARLKAETELAELRKTMADPKVVDEYKTKLSTIEQRNKELEDHIRFVDYSKSAEFAEKYQKPYTDAWKRWMGDLGELTVPDPATGADRQITANDIAELVNMPLQRAREQAESMFGNFANDVMAARKEIKALYEAQHSALEEAKKSGAERISQQQKEMQERVERMRKEVNEIWTTANQSAQTDERFSKYFKPVEGDEEGNQRLAKGYEMADKAFSVDPFAPGVTPEQRAEIVRLHAAVRNRAAAFGRIAFQNQKLQKQIEDLTKELNGYRDATPGAGTVKPADAAPGGGSARDQVMGALHKYAKTS